MRKQSHESEHGSEKPSSPEKAGVYLGAIAALSLIAIIIYVVFLSIYYSGKTDGIFDVIAEMILYLISTLGLLIAYTCGFWSASNQMPSARRFARAVLCGFLFPIMVILLKLIIWSVVTGFDYRENLNDFNVLVVAFVFSFVLGIPLASIGLVRSPLKQP
jgi:hypothetical protein